MVINSKSIAVSDKERFPFPFINSVAKITPVLFSISVYLEDRDQNSGFLSFLSSCVKSNYWCYQI